jgi:glycosyltransferase involved in cell wall biosynthesis
VLDLSVVVPVRNAEMFIDGCLSAIARAEPREIIVVDGNSTDQTVEIARRYPVRVLCDQGKGVAAARMLGVTSAVSDAVALIDVDILLPDDALERLLAELREGGYAALQATIFNRDVLLRYGFDERFASGEDIELRWRLREGGEKLGVSRQTVVEHRFDDTFSCARGQFTADGEGLARMAMKYHLRATHLLAIPAAGAVRGIGLSLAKAQPQWLPYFVCYTTLNYAAMAGQFVSALRSRLAALNPRTNYEQA